MSLANYGHFKRYHSNFSGDLNVKGSKAQFSGGFVYTLSE